MAQQIYNPVKWAINEFSVILSIKTITKENTYKQYRIPTLRLSQPFSKPSSKPLSRFPERSRTRSWVRPWSSLLLKIGFRLSPSRLSARRSSSRESWSPASSRSVSRRNELSEKSRLRRGHPVGNKVTELLCLLKKNLEKSQTLDDHYFG